MGITKVKVGHRAFPDFLTKESFIFQHLKGLVFHGTHFGKGFSNQYFIKNTKVLLKKPEPIL